MKITDIMREKKYEFPLDEVKRLLNITKGEKIDYITVVGVTLYITTREHEQATIGLDECRTDEDRTI